MSIEDDVEKVLVTLADYGVSPNDEERGRHALEGDELVKLTGFAPNRLNDAVEVLEGRNLVELRNYLGTAPFDFGEVKLTAGGRVEAERIAHAPGPLGNLVHSALQTHDKASVLRRQLLEELYKLNIEAPAASGNWPSNQRDPDCAPRMREAKYLREKGLVSGKIGPQGDLALKLTARGRDYVENGGFWQKSTVAAIPASTSQSTSTVTPEQRLPCLKVKYGDKLGSGAFGTVWRATDTLLEREVAVKFLTSTAESFDEDALIREARSLAKIAHPNLVTVFVAAYLRHPETQFVAPAITMELLDGEPLAKWWSRQHESHETFRVLAGMSAGVLAMHDAELIHGDLHAENVMILADATPKLIDWRYQDTFLQRSSSARRNEIGAEQRRAIDLIVTLLDKQGHAEQSLNVRRMGDLKEVVLALESILIPKGPATTAAVAVPAFDDNDALNVLEHWVNDQTRSVHGNCALTSPVDVSQLEQQLELPTGAVARLLPDVLTKAGWEIQRCGARTWQIVPSLRLRLKIETGMG